MLGFLGPNGSGKTTTMRSIMGLIALDAGAVYWKGEPITADTRHEFGYMPAERGMYPKMGVRDQLVYFARLAGRSAADARSAADGWIERMGLTERATAEVQSLSSGNQQRVQLAIALVHEPELLILDEPFSGLDPARGRDDEDDAARAGRPWRRRAVQQPSARPRHRHLPRRRHRRPRTDRPDGDIRDLREQSPLRRATVHYAATRCSRRARCPTDGRSSGPTPARSG